MVSGLLIGISVSSTLNPFRTSHSSNVIKKIPMSMPKKLSKKWTHHNIEVDDTASQSSAAIKAVENCNSKLHCSTVLQMTIVIVRVLYLQLILRCPFFYQFFNYLYSISQITLNFILENINFA